MRYLLAALVGTILFLTGSVYAQAPKTVEYGYTLSSSETLTMVRGWTPVLYVNGTRFQLTAPTCNSTETGVICTVPAPDFSAALTPTGPQTFTLALLDSVLGEGPKSSPLLLARPGAVTSFRFP